MIVLILKVVPFLGEDDQKYIFISEFEIIKISTEDIIMDFISPEGNNMIPTAIAVGKIFTYLISDHYKLTGNNKIVAETLLNFTTIASILWIIILLNMEKVLSKRWSVINFTVFSRRKKLKILMRMKLYGDLRENYMTALRNKRI